VRRPDPTDEAGETEDVVDAVRLFVIVVVVDVHADDVNVAVRTILGLVFSFAFVVLEKFITKIVEVLFF
jgi:hypothetical protein